MLKGFLGIILFFICLGILFLMLTGGFILNTIRKFRKAAQQAAGQQARQHRDETGRQRQQYHQRQQTWTTQNSQSSQTSQDSQEAFESASYQTPTGETIIDQRHQHRENRKIFDDTDGEYVEFTES